MRRTKSDPSISRRFKLSHFLFGIGGLYLVFIACKFPKFLRTVSTLSGVESDGRLDGEDDGGSEDSDLSKSFVSSVYRDALHRRLVDNRDQGAPLRPSMEPMKEAEHGPEPLKKIPLRYGRITGEIMHDQQRINELPVFERMAEEAWMLGLKAWNEADEIVQKEQGESSIFDEKPESCPSWVSMSGDELLKGDNLMFLPCGLAAGSSITVVGTPHHAHKEYVPQLSKSKKGEGLVSVSQFMVELQGLKTVDGEDPPKILHLNPRIRGDWSKQPVIEHNTCYRMHWGSSQRCDGLPSGDEDGMLVDGYKKCERWMRNEIVDSKESKTTSWFKRFIGRKQKPAVTWPFPFIEGRMFVLTLRAGVDGFHINVGGRHVTSFPYRTGFTLEDATGLAVKGNVDVHSIHATSLPTSHPSFSPQRVLEMSESWKASPLPKHPIKLLIGVLSASNHFAERMAVRKTWMQSPAIKYSDVVVRFFVALNPRKEINAVLKKEAAYFGDIVILPFMDRYELVVLKTVAICEFGIKNVSAAYVMKCDDDTFIRVDKVLKEIEKVPQRKSLYMGNLNLLHRPLRNGKWAVTYEEWPEEVYPPYANGPAYVISSDIVTFILSQHKYRKLRLFKMEDVSMGMWVERYNTSTGAVHYAHNWKFCQYGCMDGYFTAHYQSPRQMICLWDKLSKGQGRPRCCNFR
ncbi:hydroxyproline O-galactosyltransferase GALT2-like [Arachis stenosperma]|uniref:hydroxyproline O-galactosyltransferase GALT2-like n=1 Tax=Arachis stenosperma TaxID=217475 RepID=UPI0025ABACCB|nr:hydroxyproline O-galactosyltransferase GALT2-like [Arachis stenosperma]